MGVSWFAARSYCYWLSLLTAAGENLSYDNASGLYRLPSEIEWEWAAAGRSPGGRLRDYPWPPEKGGPSDKLANYGRNVGATTPVGRYPDGATPEGLMDMAGNVWEWMQDLWDDDRFPVARSLRGGSWFSNGLYLRCSARNVLHPDLRLKDFGFRLLCSQS